MPPVKMTRAEYQAKYGAPTAAPSSAPLGTPTAAPVQMTRADYTQKYGNEAQIADKLNPVQNLGVGMVKGAASTVQSLGQIALKGANALGISKLINGQDYNTKETFSGNDNTLKPSGVAQNIGYYGEKTGEFFIPSSSVATGQKAITGAVDALPLAGTAGAFAKGALGVLGRAIPEALSGAGVTYAQTGGDLQQAKDAGLVQGGISAGFGALGSAYRGLRGTSDLVETGINKGIRPSVVGKNNAAQTQQYMDKAKEAVNLIAGNKDLKFETNGEMVARAPKTLDELSTAISDTKQSIFSKYNAMAQDAGAAGRGSVVNLKDIARSKVPLQPISDELTKVANNKVLQDTAPDVARYAAQRAQALSERGVYTPAEAQEAIKMMNENLSAFYRNPSPELAQKISIDALVANKMRESLDATISGLQGTGYQELKSQYGALSTIEKDVAHRAVVEARKNAKGLIDFSDILSAGQVMNGILSMHPAGIAQGVTGKIVSSVIKNANSADKHIERMFGALTGDGQTGTVAGRLFGAYGKNALGTPEKKIEEAIVGYAKNPKLGLSMQDISKTPESVAAKMDKVDVDTLSEWLTNNGNKPALDMKANGILDAMGIKDAPPEVRRQFAEEATRLAEARLKNKPL